MTFANSLDPDQAWQNVGPDPDPNCLTPERKFWKLLEDDSNAWRIFKGAKSYTNVII